MARTALTITEVKSPFVIPAADGADITWVAADVANGQYFVCTGRELLVAWNDGGGSPYYVTVTSVDDEKGRAEDINQYDVGIDEIASFGIGLTNSKGWKQTNGQIYVDGENASIKFAVLRLPAGVGR